MARASPARASRAPAPPSLTSARAAGSISVISNTPPVVSGDSDARTHRAGTPDSVRWVAHKGSYAPPQVAANSAPGSVGQGQINPSPASPNLPIAATEPHSKSKYKPRVSLSERSPDPARFSYLRSRHPTPFRTRISRESEVHSSNPLLPRGGRSLSRDRWSSAS
jgi:hypothetical protein